VKLGSGWFKQPLQFPETGFLLYEQTGGAHLWLQSEQIKTRGI
jgi:hypothetical protein